MYVMWTSSGYQIRSPEASYVLRVAHLQKTVAGPCSAPVVFLSHVSILLNVICAVCTVEFLWDIFVDSFTGSKIVPCWVYIWFCSLLVWLKPVIKYPCGRVIQNGCAKFKLFLTLTFQLMSLVIDGAHIKFGLIYTGMPLYLIQAWLCFSSLS